MFRVLSFYLFFFIFCTSPALAQLRIASQDVTVTKNDGKFINYSWKVVVESDEDLDDCNLFISFRDDQDKQIHLAAESIILPKGTNDITGEGICKYGIWKLIKEYKAQISCR